MLARTDEVDCMSLNRRISVIPPNCRVFCATLCLLLIAGCHGEAKKYVLEGSVMRKNPSNQQISISHGDIPGFMPAMTMDYKVRDLGAFREVEPGDRIRADLYVNQGNMNYWLENMKVTDRSRRGLIVEGKPHVLQLGEIIPDIPLVNQDGKTIRLSQFEGAALLVTFIYTRCPLPTFCPRITSQFASIHDKLLADPPILNKAHLVSISFDPEYDKPEVLKKYGLAYMQNPDGFASWDFASPSPDDLKKLAYAFGLQYYPDGNQIAHSVATFLISPEGALARIWPDNEWKTADVFQALTDETKNAQGYTPQIQRQYVLKGTITSIDSARHAIEVNAKSIPGYMKATTMSYEVADSISMRDLKEGDHIQADLIVARDKSYLQKITVVGSHRRPGGS